MQNPQWPDWEAASRYFLDVWDWLPTLGYWTAQLEEKLILAHKKYAAEYAPQSAFGILCKFWTSKGSEQYRASLLRDVLKKDPHCSAAWAELGYIECRQEKWLLALDKFRYAIEDE